MPFKVGATVVDISRDRPRAQDHFLVDTNVWFWLGYPNPQAIAVRTATSAYVIYVNQVRSRGGHLDKMALSFLEIAHSVEYTEYTIFSNQNPTLHLSLKQYRQNYPQERAHNLQTIQAIWANADAMTNGQALDVHVDASLMTTIASQMTAHTLDGYDWLIAEAARSAGITQLITDDADFGQVAGLEIYTANTFLLREARLQGRLVRRKP